MNFGLFARFLSWYLSKDQISIGTICHLEVFWKGDLTFCENKITRQNYLRWLLKVAHWMCSFLFAMIGSWKSLSTSWSIFTICQKLTGFDQKFDTLARLDLDYTLMVPINQNSVQITEPKNNDYGGSFKEYGLYDKILNNFREVTFKFLTR